MEGKILNIVINKNEQARCLNNSSNVIFYGYTFHFQTEDETMYHFSEINNDPTLIPFEDYSFVRFIIHRDNDIITCFSKDASRRLLDYFMKGQNTILCNKHPRGTSGCMRDYHDCCGFVCYLYDILCTQHYSVRITNPENIEVTDIVFMAKQRYAPFTNFHYAIYLGDGVYISKFGESGSIIFNDLNNLMIGFGAKVFGVVEMIK